ncbi:MAG: hypothetical protein U1D99_06505, partial [Candidatus Omnitrophota bacterium]|nr:hypothetical protein [Candidatus Omnitrophota bacterium]
PTMNTDGWDWEDSALRMPFRSYVIYKPSETFLFVAGVLVRIDYDEEVLPIIGFIYKPNDRLTFNFASDDPHVSYRINEKLTAFWELGFTYDEYEVTRQGKKGVILKYRETSTGAGLRYAVADVVDASLSAGGVFNRKLEYRDGTSWIEPEATPYARAKIDVHF